VIERQILRVLVIAALLAAIPVTDINPCPFHRRLASVATHVNIMPKADDRRYREHCRRRVENVVTIVFLNEHRTAEP
jgi:hypothetical protein